MENGTYLGGLAALATNRLQDQGFNVLTPVDANSQNYTRTTITAYKTNIDPAAIAKIEKEFGTTSITTSTKGNPSYDLLVVVGTDYNLLQGKKLIN